MLTPLAAALAWCALPGYALPSVPQAEYYAGLVGNLTAAGFGSLLNALSVANTTQAGQDLVNALYSDQSFTIYAPVDSAWQQSGLTDPPAGDELNSILSYHIVTATINSTTDGADPRQHTIALTLLRNPTVLLPGDQTQVLVLESAPTATDGTILIRGDTYNATSVGAQVKYENLLVQPIDRVLAVPSPLLETMSKSGLAQAANLGATSFVSTVSSLDLNETLEKSRGATFFVPVNSAFDAIQSTAATLNTTQLTTLLQNHVLNGTVAYSSRINPGASFVTAAGQTIAFASNSSGGFLTSGVSAAKILRADIPVANGVAHLIDSVLVNTASDPTKASSAVSSATNAATGALGGVTGAIGVATSTTPSGESSGAPSASASGKAHILWDAEAAAKAAALSTLFGAFWL